MSLITTCLLLGLLKGSYSFCPPLISPQLSSLAQEWADQMASEARIDMIPEQRYGQNIFMARTGNLKSAVNDAIQNWYKDGRTEYCWEDVTENWENSLALDFSQVVWKNTKFLGIGATTTRTNSNKTVVIALYDPSGNIVIDGDNSKSEESFRSNVLPLQIS
ncbi:unnamed protein product [Orchesella dallaii]|uniref:SCP domain-containing protein n=1 Tax=Orchesella dallaii TaxID=48710 RepID=A0ABP1S9M0_9HEXA